MPTTAEKPGHGAPDLFSGGTVAAFEEGAVAAAIQARNRQLGNLLLAERAVFYVQILYRMLLYRRDHELEPLYETLYEAVKPAQELAQPGSDYDPDQFRADLHQLEDWGLVRCRIEVERLRGYRDTRLRKFRYMLERECLHFLEWLEEAAQADFERSEGDARDLLEEISGSLSELTRLLHAFQGPRGRNDDPRRILFRLDRLTTMTTEVNVRLGEFNATLIGFVAHRYSVEEARLVLRELEEFVDGFLRHIHDLRGAIIGKIEGLLESPMHDALLRAAASLDEERRRSPHLLRRSGEFRNPERIPYRLWEFFREDGKLDALSRRIHDSAIKVWRKLHAHLRELERRSTRLDDLRARV
ncbi:MAG: DUF2397 family protein, partial [Lentisphaeria bacterium]|nr:DUF2397 family protein [Lentisphaeria bacterium]